MLLELAEWEFATLCMLEGHAEAEIALNTATLRKRVREGTYVPDERSDDAEPGDAEDDNTSTTKRQRTAVPEPLPLPEPPPVLRLLMTSKFDPPASSSSSATAPSSSASTTAPPTSSSTWTSSMSKKRHQRWKKTRTLIMAAIETAHRKLEALGLRPRRSGNYQVQTTGAAAKRRAQKARAKALAAEALGETVTLIVDCLTQQHGPPCELRQHQKF